MASGVTNFCAVIVWSLSGTFYHYTDWNNG